MSGLGLEPIDGEPIIRAGGDAAVGLVTAMISTVAAERDEARAAVEAAHLDLGAIFDLIVADRPYRWRLDRIAAVCADAAARALGPVQS